MPNPFQNVADHPAAPATRVFAITPHDTNPLADTPKALYVGTGGSIVVQGLAGGNATFAKVPDGAILPVRAAYVRATGTTASDIVGLA